MMEESHAVFLSIPDVAINEEFFEENSSDDKLVNEDVVSDVKAVLKEELHVEEELKEAQNNQFVGQNFLQDINNIIKDEIVLEEVEKEENTQELYLFTSMNKNICEEVDSTQECELNTGNSIQNQYVFLPSPSLLKRCTPVEKNIKHQCDVCMKTFTRSSYLRRHKIINTCIKRYQCDVCTKSFTRSSSLTQHKLIHFGIKNYQCDVCEKTFTHAHHLSYKLMNGIKNYHCYVCEKTLTHACQLSQHKLINSGIKNYQCDVCTQTFTHATYLSKHKLLIHSAINKHQCDVCTESFTCSSNLTRHKLIHSGIKKYHCDVCEKLSQPKLLDSGIKNTSAMFVPRILRKKY